MMQISLQLMITVFMGGLLSFFSPCIFPIIPIYVGILGEGGSKYQKLINTFLFVIGLGLTFIGLGYSLSYIGDIFFNRNIKIIAGIIVIILGLQQMGIFNIKALQQTKTLNIDLNKYNKFRLGSSIKSFILGLTFSLGWTPCVGPILALVLGYAGNSENTTAIILMTIYTLGLVIPFIIFSILSESIFSKTRKINEYLPLFKKLSGVLIVIMGILLLLDKLNIFV